tara:strand:+ start:794 stop:1102 length:309 start_codon:yes stop_codon:yes gene_type:complete
MSNDNSEFIEDLFSLIVDKFPSCFELRNKDTGEVARFCCIDSCVINPEEGEEIEIVKVYVNGDTWGTKGKWFFDHSRPMPSSFPCDIVDDLILKCGGNWERV